MVIIGRDAPKPMLLAMFGTDNLEAVSGMRSVPTLEENDALRNRKFTVAIMPADAAAVAHLFAEDVQRPGVMSVLVMNDGFKPTLNYVAYLTHLKTRQHTK